MSPSAHQHQYVAALEHRIAELLTLDDETFWSRDAPGSDPLVLPVGGPTAH